MESQSAHIAYPRTTPSPPTKATKVRAYALSPYCFLCHDYGEKEARVLLLSSSSQIVTRSAAPYASRGSLLSPPFLTQLLMFGK